METNKHRLLSLDILRGITVAGMILVNSSWGESFEMLLHSHWNGLTPCDLVFPFFLFIMGVSCYLSLSKTGFQLSAPVVRKILRRTALLFLIGLGINWLALAIGGDVLCFSHLRIWAVLQRIAVCYCAVSFFALLVNHKYLLPTIIGLLTLYGVILLVGNGYAEDDSNIAMRIDLAIFGRDHLYRWLPIDPEGLLGTISATAHAMIGFYCGKLMKQASTTEQKAIQFFRVGASLLFIGYLLSYEWPINKTVWSPSYALITCGLAALLQGLLMYVIDIKGHTRWTTFFHVFGINPLALYASSEVLAIVLGHFGINGAVYEGISSLIAYPKLASLCFALYCVLLNFAIGYALYRKKIYIKL